MYEEFSLMSPEEVLAKKYGICIDQVEFERLWFSNHGYLFETYIIEMYYPNSKPGHSFLIYKDEKGWNWFENAWYDKRGIHTFDTKEKVLEFVKINFMEQNNIRDYNDKNLYMYSYDKLPYHINYEKMDELMKTFMENSLVM